ncbi:hypothetical protein C7974DRAFT_436941 [Boeremia exigua]|uniref:uncharacterized protein n=1 Tax=Boeremia exigua TaxID=749465 RepID=UPI001E8DA80B|nr:uncharacterized protein C7974DRAFT_436941 [Boeremia exigua]KAH6614994.1 hypothetical protein C7974DRAFT_436941 [Boeremia exigua]
MAITGFPPRNPAPARTVYQWENGTWAENIAVRSNGDLLVTLMDRPELYSIKPDTSAAKLAANLDEQTNAIGLLGITEMAHDVFVIVAGNFSVARRESDPASFSVWEIDFNRGGKCEKVKEVERFPQASFLNGMVTLNRQKQTVLISDSVLGLVWRLNTRTGEYAVVLEDATMTAPEGSSPVIGINGIRIFGDYLYYVNAQRQLYCRVKIDLSTGMALGPYEVITTEISGDDFAMAADGTAYVTTNAENGLERVTADGQKTLVAGGLNSTVVAGATSAAFGRTRKDKDVVYVVTSGAQGFPVGGTFSEGGKVVAVPV